MPKVQFVYTRTTFDQRLAGHANGQKATINSAPIRSPKNATFQFSDGTCREPSSTIGPRLGRLSARLRNTTLLLGFNSDALAAATRMKSQTHQVMRSINASTGGAQNARPARKAAASFATSSVQHTTTTTTAEDLWSAHAVQQRLPPLSIVPSPVPAPVLMPPIVPAPIVVVQTRSVHVQTAEPPPCAECTAREAIQYQTRDTQTVETKTASVRTQTMVTGDAATETNGGGGSGSGAITVPSTIASTVAQPLQKSLSSMSAGQLVAMTDFARIICDPWPANSVEMFKLREQLMDVYNLSQRDDEQVAKAERDKLNSVRNLLAGKKAAGAAPPSASGMPAQQQQQPPNFEWGRNAAFDWSNAQRPPHPDGDGGGHYDQSMQQPRDWRWSNDPKQPQQPLYAQQHQQHSADMQPWSGGMAPHNNWPHPGDMRGPFGGGAARGPFGRGGRGRGGQC